MKMLFITLLYGKPAAASGNFGFSLSDCAC
jgi:hypothetical protein